ncbi:MAG: DUF1343 domain-containing protein [Bacteroidales bacterium]|nr:DUF1343 domain-containing protein [Bacteroidales bacterium]
MKNLLTLFFLAIYLLAACQSEDSKQVAKVTLDTLLRTGAEQTEKYLPLIQDKRVAIVTNQTGNIGRKHLVDSLISIGIKVVKVMSPEHGFRGEASAGEHVKSSIDTKTGLPIVSLYGNHKKPTAADFSDVDIILFDLQDVGVRFYTYISTLQYVMEACADFNKPILILDRPNPNGHFVDGPVLKGNFKSFVGMQPIPIAHGMTVGEYAKMLNGEGWLNGGKQCSLTVIKVNNYTHNTRYRLPIAPSPNLPNMASVYLYPSLCLFEGTPISIGRGTNSPFQLYGHPDFKQFDTVFIPISIRGKSNNPKWENKACNGYYLGELAGEMGPYFNQINLFWLIDAYNELNKPDDFFKPFFNLLAGTDELSKQIKAGLSEEEIKKTWEKDIESFKLIRKKYLLYPDFKN